MTGTFVIEGSKLTEGKITVDMTSLESNESQRDARMENGGLETQDFPTATFSLSEHQELTSIEKNQEITLQLPGLLTLHGQTQNVSFPVTAKWNGKVITLSGELEINLSDYDISPPDTPFVKVHDEGTIKVQLLFVPRT